MFKGLENLETAIAKGAKGAPVHLWNPELCGEIDIFINREGQWFYNKTPITRLPLVRLFSSVLKREGEDHFLVTPHEKLKIRVEEAPFLIAEMKVEGEGAKSVIEVATTLGQGFTLGREHPLRFLEDDEGFKVFAEVRNGLEGIFSRAQTLALVDMLVEHEGEDGIFSSGVFFPLNPS